MKVLLDTNILLDVLLMRPPWATTSKAIWDASDAGAIEAYISAISPPNIFYVVRRLVGLERAYECVGICLEAFTVLPVDDAVLREAAAETGPEFEDHLQAASATRAHLDCVVTRDSQGFAGRAIRVYSPVELLQAIGHAGG